MANKNFLLLQMEEEKVKFESEKGERIRRCEQRQQHEIDEFDNETVQLGMNSLQIAEASTRDNRYDDLSIRGSMISLSASSSSGSFTSQNNSHTYVS